MFFTTLAQQRLSESLLHTKRGVWPAARESVRHKAAKLSELGGATAIPLWMTLGPQFVVSLKILVCIGLAKHAHRAPQKMISVLSTFSGPTACNREQYLGLRLERPDLA